MKGDGNQKKQERGEGQQNKGEGRGGYKASVVCIRTTTQIYHCSTHTPEVRKREKKDGKSMRQDAH